MIHTLHARYAAHLKTRARDDWAEIFKGSDACVTPALMLSEASLHPHMAAHRIYRNIEDTSRPAPAPRFSRNTPVTPSAPTAAVADGASVLEEEWLAGDEIAALADGGLLL
ncbi:MAG: hypothetical protein AAGH68_11655 [Pseudomonadota bacterium]